MRNGTKPFELRPVEERFWEKVNKDASGGCWEWIASVTANGYGQFAVSKTEVARPHRWAYEALVGPIPEGLQLDHLCRNRRCVNPAHLEPVTARENTLRGETRAAANAAKTHCPLGHAYDEANTFLYQGRRTCRTCRLETKRRYNARLRGGGA